MLGAVHHRDAGARKTKSLKYEALSKLSRRSKVRYASFLGGRRQMIGNGQQKGGGVETPCSGVNTNKE